MSTLVFVPETLFGWGYISDEELDRSLSEAKKNGKQENNLNANYHFDPEELNDLHPFWATDKETQGSSLARVSFNATSLARDERDKDIKENTDFIERGERPLCKVAKIVKAIFEGKAPIWKIVSPIKDKFVLSAMDLIFEEVLGCIKSGKTYRFCDSSSLRLKSSPDSIDTLEKAYIIFRYIAGFPPLPIKVQTVEEDDIEGKLRIIREKIERICGDVHHETPSNADSKTKLKLVRQASRSVYCCSPPK